MSDLRGLSRGSKLAAVVVLVVLLQVIVVAVLGLGAIVRDREEGARLAREEAQRNAASLAATTLERTVGGLSGALRSVADAAHGQGGLGNVARDGWLRAFRELYLVDAEGRIRSAGGTLLHVPIEVIDEEKARVDQTMLQAVEDSLSSLSKDDPALVAARLRYVQEFPWALAGNQYARAVGEALHLAGEVARAPTPLLSVERAVLLAYGVASANDGRAGAEYPGFPFVEGQLVRLVESLPPAERDPLLHRLGDLRAAREGLKDLRRYVLSQAKDAAAYPAPPRVFSPRPGELVALVPLPRVGNEREALLARLDRSVVASLAQEAVPAAARSAQGLDLRVVQREAPRSDDPVAVRQRLEDASFDTALDVEVRLVGSAAAPARSGPRETFYWFILGLAALGVSIAGFVLVRILRREVHLARLKADFVSNLSHELKTPLTSISMFVEMMKEGSLREGAELEEGIGVVAQETERLQRIVSRMIDVARREAAAVPYDLVPGDLNAPVRAACDRFRRLARDPGLSLAVDLAPSLPPVALDASAIDDAVTNLLANASKYRRGDRVSVRVATRPRGRGVELTVEDDGVGIARRDRKRVFEMFFRADNLLSRSVPGTGLGLALVRTIVRAHRGKVRIEGAPGAGTTFRLRFPAARRRGLAAVRPPVAPSPAGPARATPSPGRSPSGGRR